MKKCLMFAFLFLAILFCGTVTMAQTETRQLPEWALGGFARVTQKNPIIEPREETRFVDPMTDKKADWESNDTFNPGAVLKNGKIVVLYRAEDKTGVKIGHRTSRLGYAASKDGVNFKRKKKPVLYPANDDQKEYEWPGGCEDPRVAMTEDGVYVVFYRQWNRKTPRLGVATSKNLVNWTKHGPIFRKSGRDEVFNRPHKSASIVTKLVDGRLVITKVNGKYWMYWGEHGVHAATSDNLLDWEPLMDEAGNLRSLIKPRKGYFDSHLTECGPPAVMTEDGIVLLYNGKNLGDERGDQRFHPNSYCAGQVLFDRNDPTKPLDRLDVPFLRPMADFEKSGQYVNGTVFIQGLVYFKEKWFLYYGCADSKVAVAVYDPANPAPPDSLPDE